MLNRELRRVQEQEQAVRPEAEAGRPAQEGRREEEGREEGHLEDRSVQFLRDVRIEMKKVIWPSRQEVINYTVVVLVTVTVVATFILVLDLGLSKLLHLIIA